MTPDRRPELGPMRYVYIGDKMSDPALVGLECDPVRHPVTGLCTTGRGNALVRFENGEVRVVILRRLRVRGEEGAPATRRSATTTFHRPVTGQPNPLFGHRNDWARLCPWCPEFEGGVSDPERKRAYQRTYHAANRERIRERKRASRAANLEERREHARASYAANAEQIRDRRRASYAANPGRQRERARAYRAANAERLRERNRTTRHGISRADRDALYVAQGEACAGCREFIPDEGLQIDHDHSCCPGQWSCGRCIRGLLCASCNSRDVLAGKPSRARLGRG